MTHRGESGSATAEPLLSVRDLRIGYGNQAILPAVSFELKPGQVTSIVGHNGSGKSTLLKTLLGLHPKVSGEIRRAPHAKLGYVPQREAMDPIYPIRVVELVQTGRYGARGVGRFLHASDWVRIREAMDATGVRPLSKRLFRTLSGGEQQRALLARALCIEPSILVLDEPTASMDERGASEAMKLTLDLAKKSGAAILMVNHFIDLVAQVSDQVVLLDRDHQVAQVGGPAELLKNRGRVYGG
jgi:ABC-type Mn2+/Zn2+ transport system ATPase subunit